MTSQWPVYGMASLRSAKGLEVKLNLDEPVSLILVILQSADVTVGGQRGTRETAQHIQGGFWFPPVEAGEGGDSCTLMDSTAEGQEGRR